MGMKTNQIKMIYLFIIFVLIGNQHPVNAELSNIDTLRQFAKDSYDIMKSIYDMRSESSSPSTADIMEKVKDITTSIDKWGTDIELEQKLGALNPLIRDLPYSRDGRIKQDMYDLNRYIRNIGFRYKSFSKYLEDPDSLSAELAGELADGFTSEDKDWPISIIRDIFSVMYAETWGHYKVSPVIRLARKIQEDNNIPCDVDMPQRRFLDYYLAIIVTEMRALTMIDFGYLMKGFKKNASVDYTADMKMAGEEFIQRAEKYMLVFRNAMKVIGTQFRACDPPEGNKRDETFYEFERFIQYIVAHERTLTSDGECKLTCDTLPATTRIHRCNSVECDDGEHICQGDLRYCKDLGRKADLCLSYPGEARKYQWIKDGWGVHHPPGTKECDARFDWVSESGNCGICRCICTEDAMASFSDHFISMREQLSDVADNMVIVGLRFRMANRILQVEIQQGPLGPNAKINGDKVEWKEAAYLEYALWESIDSNSWKFYGDTDEADNEEMIPNKDVAVLEFNSRRIGLDKLTAPSNHVLTGIRFVRDTSVAGQPLHIEIQATPFDFESGELDSGKSVWIGREDTSYGKEKKEMTEYKGEGWRNPEESKDTVIDTKPNTFIDVDWSSWADDASQTVIPFLDGVPVAFNPPVPLAGVGLYHKKQKGYGGFLTFVLEGFGNGASLIKHPRRGI